MKITTKRIAKSNERNICQSRWDKWLDRNVLIIIGVFGRDWKKSKNAFVERIQ